MGEDYDPQVCQSESTPVRRLWVRMIVPMGVVSKETPTRCVYGLRESVVTVNFLS
jgi:hypothetical protein